MSSEMLGMTAGPTPRLAKRYADLRSEVARAARAFPDEVNTGTYPEHEHSYDWAIR